MVRFVLIALLAGCYRPSIRDCIDRCDQSGLCPSGLSCIDGFCTSGTACFADANRPTDVIIEDVMAVIDARAVDAELADAATMADAMIDAQMPDAGIDAMADASADAMIDAMTDAPMIDAMIDAQPPDAMVDAMADAMVDAMTDAAIDAPPDAPPDAAVDAMADAPIVCPAVPTTAPCTSVNIANPQPPYCFTVCTSATTPNNFSTLVSGTWHVAVIESTAEEAAAVAALGGITSAWIALDQMTMGGPPPTTPSDGWHWIGQPPPLTFTAWAFGQPDDGDGTENHVEDCGAIGPNGWTDEQCGNARPFLIEPF